MSDYSTKDAVALMRRTSMMLGSLADYDEMLASDEEFNKVWDDVDRYAFFLEESDWHESKISLSLGIVKQH